MISFEFGKVALMTRWKMNLNGEDLVLSEKGQNLEVHGGNSGYQLQNGSPGAPG